MTQRKWLLLILNQTTFLKRVHRRGRRPARDTLLHYQSKLELVVQTALVSLELAPARPQDAIPGD